MNRASNFKEMSRDAYNVAIGLVLFWGFGLSALLCKAAGSWFSSWNRILLVVVYIILVMIGIRISRNRNPVVSFLGYNLVVVPFAAVLSVLLGWLPAISILNVAVVTNLIPCTGISLPFFSYGGTALLIQLGEIGILLSASRETVF